MRRIPVKVTPPPPPKPPQAVVTFNNEGKIVLGMARIGNPGN